MPIAITFIKSYIISTTSKHDDLILDLTKQSVDYLANSTNNTISKKISHELSVQTMKRF